MLTFQLHQYECTSPESKLREFATESLRFMIVVKKDVCKNGCEFFSTGRIVVAMRDEDLARDIIQLFRGNLSLPQNPAETADCRFHVHGKKDICKFKFY